VSKANLLNVNKQILITRKTKVNNNTLIGRN
jgi:hypothetical protein